MKFIVKNGRVQVPLCALDGVGESAGKTIEEEYEKRPFSKMIIKKRTDIGTGFTAKLDKAFFLHALHRRRN